MLLISRTVTQKPLEIEHDLTPGREEMVKTDRQTSAQRVIVRFVCALDISQLGVKLVPC